MLSLTEIETVSRARPVMESEKKEHLLGPILALIDICQ